MKIAILSDIHANLEALTAVLRSIARRGCDRVICLGDIVGYGPDPNACVVMVQERADWVVQGNHDRAAIGLLDLADFNDHARQAITWTAEELSQDAKVFLRGLPPVCQVEGSLCVHACPYEPLEWDYILAVSQAFLQFRHFDEQVCFIGHSHVPVSFRWDGNQMSRSSQWPVQMDREARYIINVGSVGQPRDGNPQAAFGIWQPKKRLFELCRVAYDVHAVQEKMRRLPLPVYLIERIAYGH